MARHEDHEPHLVFISGYDRRLTSKVDSLLKEEFDLFLTIEELTVVEDGESDLLAARVDHSEQGIVDDVHLLETVNIVTDANV